MFPPRSVPISPSDVDAVLDMVCAMGVEQSVHFLWRPQLSDPNDEMVLEAAVNAGAQYLITHNLRDFGPASRFNVAVVTPAAFLMKLQGEIA